MDSEGYPNDQELDLIRNWNIQDVLTLMDFVEELHIYHDYYRREMVKELYNDDPVIEWSVSTGGWSGNESLVYALLDNFIFKSMCYHSWQRGGHYKFRINLRRLGFKKVSEYCKENNITRQYVYKAKHKFDIYHITKKNVLIRKKIIP